MKHPLLLCLLLVGCTTLNTQQQQTLHQTASGLAQAAALAAPFVPNPAISAALYAVAAVSRAYGNSPVPVDVLVATTQSKPIASAVLPLVRHENSEASAATIEAAAKLLAGQ